MNPIIFHIDVNSAYLSWTAIRLLAQGESVDIRTIPSAIGGDISKRRGVILAKSIPAKAFQVTTGEPITDALKKCPHLHIVQPDHSYYQQCSHQMLDLLSQYSPDIHPYSIDECFMTYVSFPEDGGSPVTGAHIIRKHIRDSLGFTVNIGISTNRLLAKMASDFTKPDRVHTLFPEEIPQKMWPLPVRDLFMVGKSSARTLELLGIKNIGDLAHTDPAHPHLPSKIPRSDHLGICQRAGIHPHRRETSYRQRHWEFHNPFLRCHRTAAALKVLLSLSESVSSRLRRAGQLAGMVSVEIKFHNFHTVSHQTLLRTPSQSTDTIYSYACRLFDELWDGTPIRLLGIRTSKLSGQDTVQMNLFEPETSQKLRKLDKALDDIRRKYGKDAVVRGSFLK